MAQKADDKPTYSIQLTEAAVTKITDLLRREKAGLALQISVQPGGCSGLRYQLFFTDQYAKILAKMLAERNNTEFTDDDPETSVQHAAMLADGMSILWFDQFAVVIDPMSGPYLQGARVDYQDTLQKLGFTISNPNANGSCACGDSFQ
ncbi:iron-sulfur cluster biosynthesis family protein [Streptomyces sp. NPDC026665]|uniref:HesB/IscA family protein n=1 Tax=Streptomyces sp. NPDC026665 TaxID=3154798 RepID=UPI0033E888E1